MFWNSEPETSRFGNKMIPPVKQFIVFLVGWIGFRIFAATIQVLIGFVAKAQGQNISDVLNQTGTAMIVNSAAYIGLLIALVLIINFDIIKLFKSFKHYQSYIAGLVCLMSIFAFNYLYSVFLNIIKFNPGDNANESSIQEINNSFKFTSLVVFGIIGPVCEEITYRVGLFSYLRRKSNVLAYVLTILIFAFIHFNFDTNPTVLVNELLNIPYYMFAAFAFSFTYEKFGLAGSLTAHIANNVISLSLISVIR